MRIRRAKREDIPRLHDLLSQVNLIHHQGRPDLFKIGRKYTDDQLAQMLDADDSPIFVAEDETAGVVGYLFGVLERHPAHNILTDVETLYIDDLCVDASARGQHVGRLLYRHALAFAKERGCHNLTLNVWTCNPAAMGFYEAMGLKPQKIYMEQLLD